MFWLLVWQRASTMRMSTACTLTVTDFSSRACSLLRSLLSKEKDPRRFHDTVSPLCVPMCSSTLLAICNQTIFLSGEWTLLGLTDHS